MKGADTKIRELVNENQRVFLDEKSLELSKEGLRVLAMSFKNISQSIYEQFQIDMEKSEKQLDNREQR